jgi:hypothetical protein
MRGEKLGVRHVIEERLAPKGESVAVPRLEVTGFAATFPLAHHKFPKAKV